MLLTEKMRPLGSITVMLWSSFLLSCVPSSSSSDTPEHRETDFADLCSGVANEKLFCSCSSSDYSAKSIDCFIQPSLGPKDPIWKLFSQHSKLTMVHLRTFDGSGALTYFPLNLLGPGNTVERMIIQYGDISTIPPFAFRNSSHLSEIDLSQNNIKRLKPFAFAYLPELGDLTISGNNLTVINNMTFVELPKLNKLFLDQNNLEVIEAGAFYGLHRLTELDLKQNSLKDIKAETFKGLSSLHQLDLSYNKISHLHRNAFTGLTEVDVINLKENEIKSIDPMAFYEVTTLRQLYLHSNKLVHLHTDIFGSLKRLLYLDLRDNRLETLRQKAMALNMRHYSSNPRIYLLVSGNPFMCDCKIKWLSEFKSMEKANSVIEPENVTCIPPSGQRSLDDFDLQADDSQTAEIHTPISLNNAAVYWDVCPKETTETTTPYNIYEEMNSKSTPEETLNFKKPSASHGSVSRGSRILNDSVHVLFLTSILIISLWCR